jgi:hypothetical protein
MDSYYELFYYTIGYTFFMGVAPLTIIVCLAAMIINRVYFSKDTKVQFARDAEAKADALSLIMVFVCLFVC